MRPSNDYSPEFGRIFTLRPRSSRLLCAWWWVLHCVAGSGGLLLPVVGAFRLLVVAAVVLHAVCCPPRRPPRWVGHANGVWSLPGHRGVPLIAARGTCAGSWWVALVLGPPGRRTRLLLLRDQLEAREWRLLKAALRDSNPAVGNAREAQSAVE